MIEKTRLLCDTPDCNWNLEVEVNKIIEWHNKLCPTCFKCVIISDEDMAIFDFVKELSDASDTYKEKYGGFTTNIRIKSKDFTGGNYE